MVYKSEELFLDNVELCLKKSGCLTWREVIPDQCLNWKYPYRVDLIFYRKDFGYIGVEAKNSNTLRSGGVVAKAILQMQQKYIDKTYFDGEKISRWCVCVPQETIWDNSQHGEVIKSEIIHFLSRFLKSFCQISMLGYYPGDKWNTPAVFIDSSTQDVIKIGGVNTYPNVNYDFVTKK